jgi:peroxiredoxin Q/BCP
LKTGDKAPDFTLQDAFGKSYKLSIYKGKTPVIVYFYPKAGTSGCTKEACGIRDDWSKFTQNNIPVLGISTDDKPTIKKFIDDYKLNFPLLSDADKKVSKEYGVVGISGYDKRITFIVDKNSKIADVMEVKDIANHSKTVLEKAIALK